MIDRDRAWRRRKARTMLYQEEAQKNALFRSDSEAVKPTKEGKQHRHGALTHAQAMRQEGALGQQLQDGLD